MLDGSVKKEAIDFDVQSIAAAAKASKEVKIAEVGKDIELIIRSLWESCQVYVEHLQKNLYVF